MPYASAEEPLDIVAAFLREGLTSGERCVLASTPEMISGVEARLRGGGVAIDRFRAQGALVIYDRDAYYRPDGRFDVERSLRTLREAGPRARADGFTGLRGAGGPPWKDLDEREARDLREYEARANGPLSEGGIRALCLYDRHASEPGTIETMLRTHPAALLGGRVCDNIFYEPEADAGAAPLGHRAEWMIDRLVRSHQSDALLKDMNQALIREAMSLVAERDGMAAREEGHLKTLGSRDALIRSLARELSGRVDALRAALGELAGGSCGRDGVDHVRDETDRLARVAERLGALATLLGPAVSLAADSVDLVAAAAQTVARSLERHPDAPVELSAPPRLEGCWDGARLGQLLDELLAVALEHGWRTRFELRVEDLGDRARIVVACRGLDAWPASNLGSLEGCAEALAAMHDRLNLEISFGRELVRFMGGTLGVSVWPDARLTITVDLPRFAGGIASRRSS
jgi:signal transduction histidine kinase